MNKKKEIFPKLRFRGYKSKWIVDSFNFEFLQTNSFSRAEMDDEKGSVKNIHYGDILTKYNDILRDLSAVPFVNKNIDLSKFEEESYLKNGDIVIADTAEDFTAGKAVEVQNIDFPVLAGQHTFLCRPKISFAPGYMGYYLNSPSYHNRLVPLLTGTKVYSISKSNIKNTFILYPKNYEEQQRIADCLSSIDELIDAESRKLKALEKYKKGLMQKLFPAEGKTLPEWRFPEFQGCGEWKLQKLQQICDFQEGYAFSSNDFVPNNTDSNYIQVVRITDINNKNLNLDKVFVKMDLIRNNDLYKYLILKNDLVLSLTGAAGFNFFIWNTNIAVLNQRTLRVIPKDEKNHAIKFLIEPLIHKEINIHGTGQNNNLSKEVLKKIEIVLPTSYKEQQKIAACLSDVDTMISEQSNKVEQLKTHKKGLMQGLFPSFEEVDV